MVDGRILRKVYCKKSGNEHVSGANLKITSPGSNAKHCDKAKFRKSKALHNVGTRRFSETTWVMGHSYQTFQKGKDAWFRQISSKVAGFVELVLGLNISILRGNGNSIERESTSMWI